MNKGYTSINQSKKLLELGLDPETADMNWFQLPIENKNWIARTNPYKSGSAIEGDYPCWSLAGLLELMPKSNSIGCSLILDENYLALDDCAKNFHIDINGDTLIDVAFNAIVYMLENGYIEKK